MSRSVTNSGIEVWLIHTCKVICRDRGQCESDVRVIKIKWSLLLTPDFFKCNIGDED